LSSPGLLCPSKAPLAEDGILKWDVSQYRESPLQPTAPQRCLGTACWLFNHIKESVLLSSGPTGNSLHCLSVFSNLSIFLLFAKNLLGCIHCTGGFTVTIANRLTLYIGKTAPPSPPLDPLKSFDCKGFHHSISHKYMKPIAFLSSIHPPVSHGYPLPVDLFHSPVFRYYSDVNVQRGFSVCPHCEYALL
jgi:hypothetical protein